MGVEKLWVPPALGHFWIETTTTLVEAACHVKNVLYRKELPSNK